MTLFSEHAKRHERRAEALRLLDELISNDPDFVAELRKMLASTNGEPRRQSPKRPTGSRSEFLDRVVNIFRSSGNDWIETGDLAERSRLTKGQLGYVVRRVAPDAFESRPHPKHGKKKLWRLKEGHDG